MINDIAKRAAEEFYQKHPVLRYTSSNSWGCLGEAAIERSTAMGLVSIEALAAHIQSAIDEAVRWENENAYKMTMDEKCSGDQQHCGCVPILKQRIAELEKALKAQEEIWEVVRGDLDHLDNGRGQVRRMELHDPVGKIRQALKGGDQ